MSFLTWLSISLTTKRTGLSREPRFLYKVFRLAPCTCKLYIRCQGYPWTRAGRRRASCTKISRESQTIIYDQLHLHGNHTSSNSKSSLHFLHSFYLFTASDKGHFCITDNTLDVETRNILWCLFFPQDVYVQGTWKGLSLHTSSNKERQTEKVSVVVFSYKCILIFHNLPWVRAVFVSLVFINELWYALVAITSSRMGMLLALLSHQETQATSWYFCQLAGDPYKARIGFNWVSAMATQKRWHDITSGSPGIHRWYFLKI